MHLGAAGRIPCDWRGITAGELQAAAAEGLFVLCHPPSHTDVAGEFMSRHMLSLMVVIPLETTLAIMSLIFGGVLKEMPSLKFVLAHGGGTCPLLRGRWEHGWRMKLVESALIDRPPASISACCTSTRSPTACPPSTTSWRPSGTTA